MGRKADRDTGCKDWSRSKPARLADQVPTFPHVPVIRTAALLSSRAHLLTALHTPKARKAEQFWAIKELVWFETAFPDFDWRVSLFEKLRFGDTTVQGLQGVVGAPPPPHPQPVRGPNASHVHHNLSIKSAAIPHLPPKQQMLTFQSSEDYQTNDKFWNFFLGRVH